MGEERHSVALEADLITDEDEKAHAEARNSLRQFDVVVEQVNYWLDPNTRPPDRKFKLRVSTVLGLHREALNEISGYAGNFRPSAVEIHGSKHEPVDAYLVPILVEDLCDYVTDHWDDKSAIHLSAYVMWRINWIHPFVDGNGRTARALSYLVLCINLGYPLPGTNTIPEQISKNKTPYYEGLEAADQGFKDKELPELSVLEKMLSDMLAAQLLSVHQKASSEPAE